MSGKFSPAIEAEILELLKNGPMLQTEIADHFSVYQYLEVRQTMLEMAQRGVVIRQKHVSTYRVWLPGQEGCPET